MSHLILEQVSLHNTFVEGFEDKLKMFPDKDMKIHDGLVVHREVYPGYATYRIHDGIRDIKLAKTLPYKTGTIMKKAKTKKIKRRRGHLRWNDFLRKRNNCTQNFVTLKSYDKS